MKFQNISIHDSKLMLCIIKQQHTQWPEIEKGNKSNNISFNWMNI